MLPHHPAGVVTLISIILVAVNFRMILENMLKQVHGLGSASCTCCMQHLLHAAKAYNRSIVVSHLVSQPLHAV